MAKIYPPTHGMADIVGRIACLTDLNVGMDPEATGYENIRMRGVLLGLTQREIAKLVPDVVEFTELGEYLKLPIRCYSQGMMLRLAFGISTAMRPEIILLDEIIGVGDRSFAGSPTAKGLDRVRQHPRSGLA
jgi:ABC-2 type transport system ATP-binding protein/lipopolysaccharide transport system ATP-binding protein